MPSRLSSASILVATLIASGGWNFKKPHSPREHKDITPPIYLFSKGSASLADGAYTQQVTVPIPKARNNHTPELALTYHSDRGWSPYGLGWDLPLPRIWRSLQKGVPSYIGPSASQHQADDDFEYQIGGASGLLVRVGPDEGKGIQYRPKNDTIFAKFYYDTATGTWTVAARNGDRWVAGGAGATDNNPNTGKVFAWHVATHQDSVRNIIRYTYTTIDGNLLPSEIRYDLHDASSDPYTPLIKFDWTWSSSSNPFFSFRRGYQAVFNRTRLERITVTGYSTAKSASDTSPPAALTHIHSLDYSNSNSRFHRFSSFSPHQRQAAQFSYNVGPSAFEQATSIPDRQPNTYEWPLASIQRTVKKVLSQNGDSAQSERRVVSRLIDLDQDGDLDLLWAPSEKNDDDPNSHNHVSHWLCRRNIGGQWAEDVETVTLPPECQGSTGACLASGIEVSIEDERWGTRVTTTRFDTVQRLQDMNGDGMPDIVFVDIEGDERKGRIMVCPGFSNSEVISFGACAEWWRNPTDWPALNTWESRSGFVEWTSTTQLTTYEVANFVDFDGDTIPDFLVSTSGSTPQKTGITLIRRIGTSHESQTLVQAPYCNDMAFPLDRPCLSARVGISVDLAGFTSTQNQCEIRRMVDFDGDGLIDLIRTPMPNSPNPCRPEGSLEVEVLSGTGGGFAPARRRTMPTFYNGPAMALSFSQGLGHTAVSTDYMTMVDVDGDKRLDIIMVAADGGTHVIYHDQIGSSQPYTSVPFGTLTASHMHAGFQDPLASTLNRVVGVRPTANTNVSKQITTGFMDFDGDGLVDFIAVPEYGTNIVEQTWEVSSLSGDNYRKGPYRLRSFEIPTRGLSRDVTYARPANGAGRTHVAKHNVKEIKTVDRTVQAPGSSGKETIVSYRFSEGGYDAEHRAFAGYKAAVEEHSVGRREYYFYHDYFLRGRAHLQKSFDVLGTQLSAKHTHWETLQFHEADGKIRAWPRVAQQRTVEWASDGSTYSNTSFVDYTYYDSPELAPAGLLKSRTAHAGGGADVRIDTLDYYTSSSTDPDRIYLKSVTRTGSDRSKIATRTTHLYDGQCADPTAMPNAGLLCSKLTFRDDSLPDASYNYTYDALGRRRTTTDPDNRTVTVTFHRSSVFGKTATNLLGEQTSSWAYHPFSGKPARTCGPEFLPPDKYRCNTTDFDDYGRTRSITKDLRRYLGDYQSAVVATYSYTDTFDATSGAPPSVTATYYPDPLQVASPSTPPRTVTIYFDNNGKTQQESRGGADSAGQTTYVKTYFRYDDFGHLSAAWTHWLSPSSGYEVPARPNLADADYLYGYDAIGRLSRIRNASGSMRTFEYSGDRQATLVDEIGHRVQVRQNMLGQIVSSQRVANGTTLSRQFLFDSAGRLSGGIDEEGGVYTYTFFGDGGLKSAQLPIGRWTYDRYPSGAIKKVTTPTGSVIERYYDSAGRVSGVAMRPGESECSSPQSDDVSIAYADSSAPWNTGRTMTVESKFYRRDFDYDAGGNVTRHKLTDADSGTEIERFSKFNALGNLVWQKLPSGREFEFTYTSRGEISEQNAKDGSYWSRIEYYAGGRPQASFGRVTSNGTDLTFRSDFTDNADKRLVAADTRINNVLVSQQRYDHRANGLIRTFSNSATGQSLTFNYDSANRLTSATGYLAGTPASFGYTYHRNSALDTVTSNGLVQTYNYENEAKYLLASIRSEGAPSKSFSYDESGSRCRTEFDQTTWYKWGPSGRLDTVKKSGDPEERYYYDINGARWRKDKDGRTTLYLAETDYQVDTESATEHAGSVNVRCQLPTSDTDGHCYISDKLSTWGKYEHDGTLSWSASYAPYGSAQGGIGGTSEFGFGTKRRVQDGQLSYLGARHYDPQARVFLSPDPMRLESVSDAQMGENTLNPFVYANSNPSTNVDTNGLKPTQADFAYTLSPMFTKDYRREDKGLELARKISSRGALVGTLAFLGGGAISHYVGAWILRASGGAGIGALLSPKVPKLITDLQAVIKDFNPAKSLTNCVKVARSVELYLKTGLIQKVANSPAFQNITNSKLARLVGGELLKSYRRFGQLKRAIKKLPDGARFVISIVHKGKDGEYSHVINAIYHEGKIWFIDGQAGWVSRTIKFAGKILEYALIRTD